MDENSPSPEEVLKIILELKEKAENAARAAEDANSKANSESGFAYNAKQNAEEHAKAISQFRGAVEADIAWLSATKKNAEDLAQAINTAKKSSETDNRISSEARANVEKDAATVRGAHDRINTVLSAIEKIQTDATDLLKKVTAESAMVHQTKATVDAKASVVQDLAGQVSETASKVNADSNAIAKIESDTKSLFDSMNEIMQTSNESHDRVVEYQNELKKLRVSFDELHSKIEGLVPNATSAGLASAFRNQQQRFKKPQLYWLTAFIGTIILLMFIGARGYFDFSYTTNQINSWNAILQYLAIRLPLVAPLVWLAIYAGRHYTLALRVEEEYAFKEAVSTSFEGYKREMAGISENGENTNPPLVTLCENVLRTLAQRPGRIYEGHQEDITPLSPLTKIIDKSVESATDTLKK